MQRRYFLRSQSTAQSTSSANSVGSNIIIATAPASSTSTTVAIRKKRTASRGRDDQKNQPKLKQPKLEKSTIDIIDGSNGQSSQMINNGGDPSTTTTKREKGIHDLPNRLLVNIFQMLNMTTRIRIEGVCRRWSYVSRQYSWDHTTHKVDYLEVSDHKSQLLDDSDDDEIEANTVASDAEWFSNRDDDRLHRRAIMSRPRLTNDRLKQILDRGGTYFRSIDLAAYRDSIDYRGIRFIGQNCPRLESIDCTGLVVTNTSLRNLAIGCPRLTSVNFQRCFHDSVVERGLSTLLSTCRQLKSINLSENERLTGRCFGELSPSVRQLDLAACYAVTDEAIKAVVEKCPNLESLNLDCCDRLSTATLAHAFDRLTRLHSLYLNEFNAITDNPSQAMLANMQHMSRLSSLTHLHVNNNMWIDDSVICAVARNCPELETLDISGGNKLLTDHSLISLGRFAYKTLKRLNCNYVSTITSVGVKALSKCSQLQTLFMHRCELVRDEALVDLAKNCHELCLLDVSFCHQVTNVVVATFARQRLQRQMQQRKIKKADAASKAVAAAAASASNGGASTSKERHHNYPPHQMVKHDRKGKSSPGRIVIFAGATKITENASKKRKNDLVRLDFRDGHNCGLWGLLS